jgi:hypothetical protein
VASSIIRNVQRGIRTVRWSPWLIPGAPTARLHILATSFPDTHRLWLLHCYACRQNVWLLNFHYHSIIHIARLARNTTPNFSTWVGCFSRPWIHIMLTNN